MSETTLKYQRVLLKISGEGLCQPGGNGLSGPAVALVAAQIKQLVAAGVQPAVVTGAGNFVRGAKLSEQMSLGRVTADHMGMLATVINALALRDVLESQDCPACVMAAREITQVCEPFVARRAAEHLAAGRVLILAGGTGSPYFTTDTCAALRAAEINAEVLIKATKVDGVYSADPVTDSQARLYEKLTFGQVLQDGLAIMDQPAIAMCGDNGIDIVVCNLMKPGTVLRVARGEKAGTLITR